VTVTITVTQQYIKASSITDATQQAVDALGLDDAEVEQVSVRRVNR
jgi:hypothetical protein